MKKAILILTMITFFACSKEDNERNFFDNHRGKVWLDEDNSYYRFEGSGEVGTVLFRAFTTQETPNCQTIKVGDNIVTSTTCFNNKVVITSNTADRLEVTFQFFEGDVEDGECVGLTDVNNVGPRLGVYTIDGNQLTFSSGDSVDTFNLVEDDIPSCFD